MFPESAEDVAVAVRFAREPGPRATAQGTGRGASPLNSAGTDAKFLAIATPGVFGPASFREVGAVLALTAGGPPDLAAIAAVMRRYGLTRAAGSAERSRER